MHSFRHTVQTLAGSLGEVYGELLDSVFTFFFAADDFDEYTPIYVGIVLCGKPTKRMEDNAAQALMMARATCDSPFSFKYFSEADLAAWQEDLEINNFFWENGKRVDPAQRSMTNFMPMLIDGNFV